MSKIDIKREPVMSGGVAGGSVAALVLFLLPDVWAALASYGVVVTVEMQQLVALLVAVLVPSMAAWLARRYVTPVADPRDNAENVLLPVTHGIEPAE